MRPTPSTALPLGWTEKTDEDGKTVYWNENSQDTIREKPIIPGMYFWVKRPLEPICYHLLLRHVRTQYLLRGDSGPAVWRRPKVITRTKKQAIQLIIKYRRIILSKRKTFQEMARRYSDCPSANFNGHLGICRTSPEAEFFATLVYGLPVGQVSRPHVTGFGVHIFLRAC